MWNKNGYLLWMQMNLGPGQTRHILECCYGGSLIWIRINWHLLRCHWMALRYALMVLDDHFISLKITICALLYNVASPKCLGTNLVLRFHVGAVELGMLKCIGWWKLEELYIQGTLCCRQIALKWISAATEGTLVFFEWN